MNRLAAFLIFSVFVITSGKVVIHRHSGDDNWLPNYGDHSDDHHIRLELASRQPLWVLGLNSQNIGELKLRRGTAEEISDFREYAGPLVLSRLRSRVVKKDNPEKPTKFPTEDSEVSANDLAENNALIQDIFKVINKFALSSNVEPDAYLTDSSSNIGPSIDLYFKGDHTSLLVKLDNKVWHYFINPPSPLPEWFYEMHESGAADIKVPDNIKNKFYKSLLRLLQIFLGHPI